MSWFSKLIVSLRHRRPQRLRLLVPPTQPPPPPPPSPQVNGTAVGIDDPLAAARVLVLGTTNALRVHVGARPLTANTRLDRAAQKHAEDLPILGRPDHTGSDGSTLQNRAEAAGYAWIYLEENIAQDGNGIWGSWAGTLDHYDGAAIVRSVWMGSAQHRTNLLSPRVSQLGVGMAQGHNGIRWWVAVYGAPAI